jgi:tetratricopeptide (TPR) repeat protein
MRPADVARVIERAGGNPLYLVEIVRAARELGGVEGLPGSLDAIVGAKIDALRPLARSLLRRAAVLGGSFRPVVFDEMLAGEQLAPDDATRRELDTFLERYGDDRMRFRHALVRDVAYEGLSFRHRRELHLRAGDAIERAAAEARDAVADLLALHFARAGDHVRAWRYGVIAGDRAREAFANVEAATNYRLALDAAQALDGVSTPDRATVYAQLGEVRERAGDFAGALDAYRYAARLLSDDPLGRARVALRRARARERIGSYAVALRDLTKGLSTLESLDASGEATDEATRLRAELSSFSAVVRQAQERPRQAQDLARRAVDAARASDARVALARAYEVLDWAARSLGTPVHEPLGEIALGLYQEAGDLAGEARVTGNLGALRYLEGRWDDAARLYEQASVAQLHTGDAVQAAISGANTGELLVSQGRLDEAEPILRSAARVLRASAFVDGATFAEQQLGRLLAKRGATGRAVALLGAVHAELAGLGQHTSALEAAVHLADGLVDGGEPARALELIDDAESQVSEESGWLAAPCAHVRGRALAALGDIDGAAAQIAVGIEHARSQELPYELALLLETSAELAVGGGGVAAPAVIAEAREIAGSLGLRDAASATTTATDRV